MILMFIITIIKHLIGYKSVVVRTLNRNIDGSLISNWSLRQCDSTKLMNNSNVMDASTWGFFFPGVWVCVNAFF